MNAQDYHVTDLPADHYNALEQSLMKIDLRMAWAADSHIARGIYTSINEISRMTDKPHLVFLPMANKRQRILKNRYFH